MSVGIRGALIAVGAATLLVACAPLEVTQHGAWQQVAPQPAGLSTLWAFATAENRVLAVGRGGVASYDPARNRWRSGAGLPAGTYPGIAVALPSDRLFVTLRRTEGPDTGQAMIYDGASDRWLNVPPMDSPRENETVTTLPDGSVLIAGGFGSSGQFNPIGEAERYDPARRAWSPAGKLIDPRSGHVATQLADGRVLIVGGVDALGNPGQLTEIYDPRQNVWIGGGRLTSPSPAPQVIGLHDGRVLEIAGVDFLGSPTPVTQLYDPASGSWRIGPQLPSPGGGRLSMLPDGRVLMVKSSLDPRAAAFRAEIFDPLKMLWTVSATIVGEPGVTATLNDGRVITLGPTASWIYDDSAVAPPAPGASGVASAQISLALGGIAAILAVLVLIQYLYGAAVDRRRMNLV